MVVHVGAVIGVLVGPRYWLHGLALIVANQVVLAVAGLLPRSRLLGANLSRLPAAATRRGEVALTFDDGPDPAVTPRVLDALDAVGAQATFFCIGEAVARHPDLAREIVRRGHLIENHTARHRRAFAAYGWRRMGAEVADGQRLIAQVTGRAPRFFRAVAGLRNPLLDPLLARQGLRLAAWTRRGYDTRCRKPDTVLRRLTRDLAAGDILLLHDGNAARGADGEPMVLAVLPRLLAELRARGLRCVTLAAACDGEAGAAASASAREAAA
jgi:peptidoglycan/xylan/chitin deacetylase (PgdA/CDA1 family)